MNPLDVIVDAYLQSPEFNGFALSSDSPLAEVVDEVCSRVDDGDIEVLTAEEFPNPHIRPWASPRSLDDQTAALRAAAAGGATVCLYPTKKALAERLPHDVFRDEPFRRRLAEGAGQLEVAYFSMDVLEQYRNDPLFRFDHWDFGLNIGVQSEEVHGGIVGEQDKISTIRVGYAYDQFDPDVRPLSRGACGLLRDLALLLTPEHQQRWQTYERVADDLKPHPEWYRAMLGHWPEHIGLFQKFMAELAAVSSLFEAIYGEPLFRSTGRPRDLGWVIRPSTKEWGEFVLTLDKLLSDNLSHSALSKAGVPRKDEHGQSLGTLGRLTSFLKSPGGREPTAIEYIMKPLRAVRVERQKPAHKNLPNIQEADIIQRQSELMETVVEALAALRYVLSTHPKNASWSPPTLLAMSFRRL